MRLLAILALSALTVTGTFIQITTATLKGKDVDTDGVGLSGVHVAVSTDAH